MSITAYTTTADGTEDSFKGNLQALTQDSIFIKKDTLEKALALDQITRLEVEKDRTTGKVLFLVFGILLAFLGAIVLVLALFVSVLDATLGGTGDEGNSTAGVGCLAFLVGAGLILAGALLSRTQSFEILNPGKDWQIDVKYTKPVVDNVTPLMKDQTTATYSVSLSNTN
ncbi:MAG: hypothetical protein IPL65_17230 [Lewinellaceae bacterium]|nr:hypothetical protein [Lewinellaceae bacterium]